MGRSSSFCNMGMDDIDFCIEGVLDTMKAVMANHVFMYFNKEYGNFCIGGGILARPAKGDASNNDFSTFYGIIPSAFFIVCLPFPIALKPQFVDLANLCEVGQGL